MYFDVPYGHMGVTGKPCRKGFLLAACPRVKIFAHTHASWGEPLLIPLPV
jgi:hypothetical protein